MIRLTLLGAPGLTGPSCEIDSVLRQPKRLALLAYLASNPGFSSRDTITGLFWSESDQARARAALRSSLHFLRGAVGHSAIRNRGAQLVGVDVERVWCDAAEFDDACEAGDHERVLRLYRGEFLAGVFVSDSPELEHWVEGERARRRRAAKASALALAGRAAERGAAVEELRWLRRAGVIDPDDESLIRSILRLLVEAGDRREALAEYGALESRLRKLHFCDPDPATTAIVRQPRDLGSTEEPRRAAGDLEPSAPVADPRSAGAYPMERAAEVHPVAEGAILDLVPEMIFTASVDGVLTYVNATAAEVFGWPTSDLIGKSYLDLVRADFRQILAERYVAQVESCTAVTEMELPCVTAAGREIWIHQAVRLMRDEGRTPSFVGIARNVTERRRAEATVRQLEGMSWPAGAYDRAAFWKAAEERLRLARRWAAGIALLRVDIPVDASPADIGRLGQVLSAAIRDSDLLGYFAGAFFVLAIHERDSAPSTLEWRIAGAVSQGDTRPSIAILWRESARDSSVDLLSALVEERSVTLSDRRRLA